MVEEKRARSVKPITVGTTNNEKLLNTWSSHIFHELEKAKRQTLSWTMKNKWFMAHLFIVQLNSENENKEISLLL